MNDVMNLSKYIYLFLSLILIIFTSCIFKEKIILDSETRPSYHPQDENKVLFNAYNRKIFGKSNIYLLDKSSNKITKITNSDYFFDPIFSPDGKKIGYIKRVTNREGGDLWIMDADGTNHKQLTDNDYYDMYPSFSKDGNKIIFVRAFELIETQMGKRWYYRDIFEIDLKTLKEKQLTFKKHYSVYYPKYYKNEKEVVIYYSEDDSESGSGIFLNDINNNLVKKISTEEGYHQTYSNNFNWIAYVGRTKKSFDIFLMDIDAQEIKNLTNYQEYMYVLCPSFSQDDKKIVFLADKGFKGKWNLYEVTIDGKKINKIL